MADFSSCQGNNSIKNKYILSGLNCNIVFFPISLTRMFTNKAQGSKLTQIFSAVSSKFCLSVYEEHQNENKNKNVTKSDYSFELTVYQLRDTKKRVFF